jgi:hypothetical protein
VSFWRWISFLRCWMRQKIRLFDLQSNREIKRRLKLIKNAVMFERARCLIWWQFNGLTRLMEIDLMASDLSSHHDRKILMRNNLQNYLCRLEINMKNWIKSHDWCLSLHTRVIA